MNKIRIYQLLPRLFANKGGSNTMGNKPHGTIEENGSGKLNDITTEVLLKIKDLGITHVWYTGVIEHATKSQFKGIAPDNPDIVKGEAGSPYAIKDYYDIAPALATSLPHRMEEFEQLVTRTHQAGMKVIIDFVPNHLARQYHSDAKPLGVADFGSRDDSSRPFIPNNNFYYLPSQELTIGSYHEAPAKATGNDCFSATPSQYDWYETIKLNYGIDYLQHTGAHFDPIPDTWQKMKEILLFWAKKGVDAFRCDMAHMVPLPFWQWVTQEVRHEYPHILFIAEIYQPELYHSFITAGFDLLYDKVGLYDTLIAILRGERGVEALPYAREAGVHHQGHLLRFIENHDEQRVASDFIAGSGSHGIPAMAVATFASNDAIMIYFGQELGERGMNSEGFSGQDGRTTIFDYWHLELIQKAYYPDLTFTQPTTIKKEETLRSIELQDSYRKILTLPTHYPSLSSGEFYDLLYANPACHTQQVYPFIRHNATEFCLICCNFSNMTQHVDLSLPEHLFTLLPSWSCTPLILHQHPTPGKTQSTSCQLSANTPYHVTLPPHSYLLHHFTCQ